MSELVLIDTSAWIHALRKGGSPRAREAVGRVLVERRAATSGMIMLELLGGCRNRKEYEGLSEDFRALHYLPVTDQIWTAACVLSHGIRQKGFHVPATDHLIASVAIAHRCRLLHADRHFELLAKHSTLTASALRL
jgi:predicted nucleic acid-binding protein